LFVGRTISGICGASLTTASAYIADVSEPEKKTQNFGLIGVAFGVGFIIGPVIGGIAGKFGTRIPFLIAACFALLNFLYGLLLLPESLSPELRRPFSFRRSNPAGAMAQLKKYPLIAGLALSSFLLYLASQSIQSTWTFFTMQLFKWDTAMVGLSLGFIGLLIALVQGVLIRVIIPKFGQKKCLYAGLALNALGFLLFSLASKGWMMFVFLLPYALGGIAGPSLLGIISNQVPDNEQGELQGAMTSLVSLTAILGPPLMTYLFATFANKNAGVYFPGAPFLMGALIILLAIVFSVRSLSRHPQL
ncbi:MAG TPA: MFS transporter, partial [Chitinophagaceae bacterium]|nr:MFS transporter [Chitinophagaceae bacterium]